MKLLRLVVATTAWLAMLISVASAQSLSPPPGAYQNSCTQIEVHQLLGGSGTDLSATCPDRHGMSVSAVLPLPCDGDIQNRNGKLICVVGNNPFAPPSGSYQASCTSIQQMGPILRARCLPSNGGSRVLTSINTLNCQGSDITVGRSGQLTC